MSMRRILIILLFFGLSACNDSSDEKDVTKTGTQGHSDSPGVLTDYVAPDPVDGVGKKLFAIYMVGSDLEDGGDNAGTNDLIELLDGYDSLTEVEKSSLDIIVAFGGAKNWPGMRIANIQQLAADYEADADVKNLDNIMGNSAPEDYLYYASKAHMGDKSSLKLFLQYLKDGYSSHSVRFLDMWDHGAAYAQFGNDSNYNFDGLTLKETSSSFEEVDTYFDTIGYDACLNANFEMASAVKSHADYMIASVETEPGHGWDYENVIPLFTRSTDPVSLGRDMVDDFVSNPDHADTDGKTLSIVDLRHYDKLSDAVTNFSDSISNDLTNTDIKELIRQAHDVQSSFGVEGYGKGRRGRRGRRSSTGSTFDLKGMAQIFNNQATGIVKENAGAILSALDDYEIYANSDASRSNANGVTIAPIMLLGSVDGLKPEQFPNKSYWDLMSNARDTYVTGDDTGPTLIAENNNAALTQTAARSTYQNLFLSRTSDDANNGTTATFEDANLASVVTGYANILIDPIDGEVVLLLGELPTVKTGNANEYFTPRWNREWFMMTVASGSNPETNEIPLFVRYDGRTTDPDTGKIVERFSGEMDFVNADRDYASYPESQKFDFARLEILVDEDNNVISHKVSPYKMLFTSEEDTEGYPVFEKYGKPLEPGDKFALYSDAYVLKTKEKFFNLETFNPDDDDLLTVTQKPTFAFVDLEFEDENGTLLPYYYLMRAADMAGNLTNTTPVLLD